ncbi:MAG: ECF-type sigma factor [Gammaproteobacteria bacterium]
MPESGNNSNSSDRFLVYENEDPVTSTDDKALYRELHRIAAYLMSAEQAGHTLQPTALINEAWLRLNQSNSIETENRQHFVAAAALQMRHALVDHARRKNAAKRPSRGLRLSLNQYESSDEITFSNQATEIVDICLAIEKLEKRNARPGQVFELRYLGGLSVPDCANYLNVSERTVKSDWKFASAWIARHLELTHEKPQQK